MGTQAWTCRIQKRPEEENNWKQTGLLCHNAATCRSLPGRGVRGLRGSGLGELCPVLIPHNLLRSQGGEGRRGSRLRWPEEGSVVGRRLAPFDLAPLKVIHSQDFALSFLPHSDFGSVESCSSSVVIMGQFLSSSRHNMLLTAKICNGRWSHPCPVPPLHLCSSRHWPVSEA